LAEPPPPALVVFVVECGVVAFQETVEPLALAGVADCEPARLLAAGERVAA